MTKPLLERYEQILAQDPASTVFVELAKTLLEKGEVDRAMDVCRRGLAHHPNSVVGRVLWGKALIQLGRPAEAMEQFDHAIGIDRDNPHAYNLIGEVLLKKGLYRSALPLLKKAVTLQPNENRVRQWLEQTQRALAGGPAPQLTDGPDLLAPTGEVPSLPETKANPIATPAAKTASPTEESAATAPRPGTDVAGTPILKPIEGPKKNGAARGPAGDDRPTNPALAVPRRDTGSVPVLTPTPAEPPKKPGLLDDLEAAGVLGEPTLVGPAPQPPPSDRPTGASGSKRALLDEIPDTAEMDAMLSNVPKVEMSPTAAKAIAEAYEKELHAKLAETNAQKTFLQRHGGKLALVTVLSVAALVGVAAYLRTQTKHRGRTLRDTIAEARKQINQDTEASYKAALQTLALAATMDDSSEEVWGLTGYAQALLFAEHGGTSEGKGKGLTALGKPGVDAKFPELTLTARYYLAVDAPSRDTAKKDVLAASIDRAEVQELAGRLLLAQKDTKGAVERFKRALEISSNNVRSLVALGNYYREAGDFQRALSFYSTAAALSPQHPERVVGAAECRLELESELDEALKDVEALPSSGELSPDLLARKELAYGRLLAANGQGEKAVARLADGVKGFRTRAYDFNMALGAASRAAGDQDAAQHAFEAALKSRSKSEDAKEALGRVLLARDHEHDVISRISAEGEQRKIFLVRGMAYVKLMDWKKARSELERTQVNGKYPSEAVMYLALVDAGEGQEDKAQDVLEKTLTASKKPKSDLRVALGQIYWHRGTLDKARAQFEEAMKDPLDYEGACALGRLKLQQNDTAGAIEKLSVAVARNGSHGEARNALGRAYLQTGRVDDALKQFEAWQAENPNAEGAFKGHAIALRQLGKAKEAETAINRAVKLNPDDAEAHRVRAAILFSRGDPKGAMAALERANKLDPKDPETFCEIGYAFIRQGHADGAAKAFEAAKREDAQSACGRIGVIALRLPAGARPAAKELSELAAKAHSAWDRAQAEAALARALLASNQLKDARKAAEQAVQMEPQMGNAHFALALVAIRQKDEAKAKEALFRAEELEPAHSGIRLALADLLVKTDSDLDRAVQEYVAFMRTVAAGGSPSEMARVKKQLPNLKKKIAAR